MVCDSKQNCISDYSSKNRSSKRIVKIQTFLNLIFNLVAWNTIVIIIIIFEIGSDKCPLINVQAWNHITKLLNNLEVFVMYALKFKFKFKNSPLRTWIPLISPSWEGGIYSNKYILNLKFRENDMEQWCIKGCSQVLFIKTYLCEKN